jgi:hypothetical protein
MIPVLVWQHFRLGYTRILLVADVITLFIIALDLVSFFGHNLAGRASVQNLIITVGQARQIAVILFIQLIVIPLLIASLRVVGVRFWEFRISGKERCYLVAIAHFGVTIALVCFIPISAHMQTLSGWAMYNGTFTYEFNSHFSSLMNSSVFDMGLTVLGSVVGVAVSGLLAYIAIGKEPSRAVSQYILRAELAELPDDLRPISRPTLLINQAATTPPIEFVARHASNFMKSYVGRSPGFQESIEALDASFTEFTDYFSSHIIKSRSGPYKIDLYTGTNRAFEAAFVGARDADLIVQFPFLSPSLTRTVGSISVLLGCQNLTLKLEPSKLNAHWTDQEADLLWQIRNGTAGKHSVILVVSEVSFATGFRLPLGAHLKNVRSSLPPDCNLIVIVDATNAAGNKRLCEIPDGVDFYVLAAHRWLLSTETSGILASKPGSPPGENGKWMIGERKTVAPVRALAGLHGTIALFSNYGFDYFNARCEKLRQEFILNMPREVRIIGAGSGLEGSYILACNPIDQFSWKFDIAELEQELSRRYVFSSVLRIDANRPWVRIALPYFGDVRDINIITQFLDSAVG